MAVETERGVHHNNGYGFGSESPVLKNMHSEAMEEYSDDMVAKLAGRSGGGRRKQSKPNRVPVFMEPEPMEMENSERAASGQAQAMDIPAEGAPGKPQSSTASEESITCDLCNEMFTTQSALTDHIQSVHQINDEDNEDNFPTRYHQLGSELLQEAGLVSAHDKDGNPDQTMLPKPSFSNEDKPSSEKPNIFHQDAYCELCNREFCNRYFLKTHKANKHGIFDDSPSESPTNGFMPALIPLRMDEEETASEQSKDATAPQSAVKSPSPLVIKPREAMKSSTSSPKTSPPPSSASSVASLTPSHTSSKPESRASNKPAPDMEDYCELCQKHFCNKYYLKKHKNDVHGIAPEETPGTKRSRGGGASSGASSQDHTMQNPLLLPQTSSAVNGNGAIPGLSNLANVMFINPFGPPMPLLPPPLMQNASHGGFPPLSGLPPVPHPIPGAESPKTSAPSSMSPTGGFPLPNEALRTMGAMSGEANCEVCKKSFCNKYFLNLHKASKHNIPMNDMPSSLPLMLPGMPGMPENLGLPGSNGKELGELPSGSKESSPPGSPESMRDKSLALSPEKCEICRKEFPNLFSLKIHLVNAHNQRPDMDFLPELAKNENMPGGIAGNTMFSNMIAAKLADRVVCDLCNKEVCNKYFLKTHKIKVHGVDPAVAERECSPQPSSKNSPAPKTTMALPTPPLGSEPIKSERDGSPRPLNMSHSMPFPGLGGIIKRDPGAGSPKPLNMTGMPPMSLPTSLPMPLPMQLTPSKDIPIPPPSDPVPRPSDSELLKMGIDPEAYCEICKKEFCSKYFLKTHKWNLHGIKTADGTPPSGAKISTPTSVTKDRPGSARRNWKWKEPANSMRVMCELCNKELCNKYFLKTHMLNKHGINIDVSAGSGSFPSVNPARQISNFPPMPPFPFPGFMKDENSNTRLSSSPSSTHNGGMFEPRKGMPAEMEKILNMVKREMKDGPGMEAQNVEVPSEPQVSPNVLSAKTWNVPEDRNKRGDTEEAMDLAMPSAARAREHSETSDRKDETIKTSDGEYPILKCKVCSMVFGDRDTLSLHMLRDHPVTETTVQSETPAALTSQKSSSSVTSLGLSLRRKYQFGVRRKAHHMQKLKKLGGGSSIAEKVKSAIVTHIQNHMKKRKFKCAFCLEKFSLRSLCQQHIRSKHKREASPEEATSEDSDSRPTLRLPTNTAVPAAPSTDTIMQPFRVEENPDSSGHFAASVVYLPVYSKISEPLSVTFKLTPADP